MNTKTNIVAIAAFLTALAAPAIASAQNYEAMARPPVTVQSQTDHRLVGAYGSAVGTGNFRTFGSNAGRYLTTDPDSFVRGQIGRDPASDR